MTEVEMQEKVTIEGIDYCVLVHEASESSYCHIEHLGEGLNASIDAVAHDGGWLRDDGSLVPCEKRTLKSLCEVAEEMGYL